MATISIDLGDRDTKRWHTCLSCLIRELEALGNSEVKDVLDKFQAQIMKRESDGASLGVGLEFPEGYKVPQELI